MLLSPPEHPFMNSTFVNVPPLARAAGEAKLLLHSNEAAVRGIQADDRVRCWNDRGHFFGRAVVTEDVRPGVAVSYGVRWAMRSEGGLTVNDTTSQRVTDMGAGATFYDNAVEVEPANG
jgi:anaerobic selenocysteine-containing dehydrogenase